MRDALIGLAWMAFACAATVMVIIAIVTSDGAGA